MPLLDPNATLQQYLLTDDEISQGVVLNPTQRAYLQNKLVEIVEQKIALTPTDMSAANKESYWQQEAYLRGQYDFIRWLFAASDAVLSSQLNSIEGS